MKLYTIKVTCRETGNVIENVEERGITKKSVIEKYENKHYHTRPKVKILVERKKRLPGIQKNLLDEIEELEKSA